jgi:predicted PurR-regulated permease PerM
MVLIALILIALFSIFVVSKIVTAPDFNASIIKSLDDKKVAVMELAAVAATSSTVISMIPGDTAMPIANQIAQLTSYFVVILGAILLEKMLIAVVGYVSFVLIIPFACFLGILYLYVKKDSLRNLAIKMAIFGIVLFVAIPVSIHVSDLIDDSYQTSIEQTIKSVEQNKANIEEKKQDLSTEDKNWVEKAIDSVLSVPSKIENGISGIVKEGVDMLTSFLETIAVLIITTCVIPIVIILIFVWIIKILFGFDTRRELTIFREKVK